MNDAATPNALPKAQVASAGAALFAVIFTMLVSQPFTPFMVHTMYVGTPYGAPLDCLR